MKMIFARGFGLGMVEKEVPVTLNLGVLETTCKALGFDFWQIPELIKKSREDFTLELIYQMYIGACKDRYQRPKYTRTHAGIWYKYMVPETQKELLDMITELWGNLEKASVKKKEAIKVRRS